MSLTQTQTISIRTKNGWKQVKNKQETNCDRCGHRLWLAPGGKARYCDNDDHTKEE